MHEPDDVPPSLSFGGNMYHSSKADILKRMDLIPNSIEKGLNNLSYDVGAMVIDFSVIVNMLTKYRTKTFSDF